MKTILLFLLTSASCYTLFAESKMTTMFAPLLTEQWNEVINFPQGGLYSMITHGNEIYIGGAFEDLAGISDADYLARWDGCEWHAVTSAINGMVNAMESNGNTLYAVGSFAGYVGKWVNNTWTTLPGLPSEPFDIAINTNGIYVAAFDDLSGDPIVNVYKWNGSTWVSLGVPIELAAFAGFTLDASANSIYIGGYFNDAGGDPNADNIAKWNGSNWVGLGNGLNGIVIHIGAVGNDIYACGAFTDAGGNPDADKIARWDGSNWNNVGTGFNNWDHLTAMLITDEYIYVYATDWNECYDYFRRYTFQTSNWDYYPEYSVWGCAESYSILEFNSDIYAANTGDIERWGEPGPYIDIAGVPYSICQDGAPISLPTTQSGYLGTWTGPGVTNNVFDPSGLYYYVSLTFTPNPGQCVSPVTFDIDVYLNNLEYYYTPTFCQNSPPVPLLPYQYGVLGSWSGPGVSNNLFDPTGLLGYYTLTFTPNAGQCYAVAQLYIQVELEVIPNIFGIPESICEIEDPIPLPIVQSGIAGNWSGQGVINNTFYPSGLNGPITLTFTPGPDFCATENTFVILVNPQITITINGVPNTLCQLSPPISLPTTQSGIPGNWSGPGVTNNSFNPANQIGNVTLTFSPIPDQCAFPVYSSIWVYVNIPVITGIPVSVCEADPPIALPTNLNGINGNWSGQGVTNNLFNPIGLEGNIPLMFNPLAGECANMATQSIHVDSLVTPDLTDLPFSMCSLDDPILLSENQGGFIGSWSGPGVSNNIFNPENLSGNILLTFTPNSGQCVNTAGAVITVQSPSVPGITGIPASICVLAAPIVLPEVQQGIAGNWSGQGVVNNMFNPNGLNGDIPLLFTPFNGECAVPASVEITVFTSFTPGITGIPATVCENASPQNLITLQNGVSGNWSGPGVMNNIFNPSGQSDTVELLFTPLPLQCATSTSWNLVIDAPQIPQIIDIPTSLCETDVPLALATLQSGIMGQWSGPGIVNDTFHPNGLSGIVKLTFLPNPNQCGLPATTDLLVNGHVHPMLADLPDSLCQRDLPIELSPVQDSIPGQWFGTGIKNNTFSPDSLIGMITLSFIANNGACEDTTTTQLFISSSPTFTNLQVTCDSIGNIYAVSFDIIGGDPASYTLDGVLLGGTSFTSSPFLYTQSTYSFVLEDAVACEPVFITGTNICLCSTYAGTMNAYNAPLRVCIGPRFTVGYNNDAHLDPDDVIAFILHDQPGNDLGHVFSMSSQPVFSYLPGMVLGQTYFISVVAGTNNGSGTVDLNDPCLSISLGVPVIFEACDPKEDHTDAEVADHNGHPSPMPFSGGEERSQPDSGEPGNSSNENADLFSGDPDAIIKTLRVYDLLGRVLFTVKNIPLAEYLVNPERFQHDLVSGYYLEVFEVEKGDGEMVYVSRRITGIGR